MSGVLFPWWSDGNFGIVYTSQQNVLVQAFFIHPHPLLPPLHSKNVLPLISLRQQRKISVVRTRRVQK